ncbi:MULTISPECIES: hypothetical protein [unclassified Micromonospora]|uniref:hypothetical protein n=1 Tax=unclassified Micromonospora TaxID=2617518 RepID=UPI0033E0C134
MRPNKVLALLAVTILGVGPGFATPSTASAYSASDGNAQALEAGPAPSHPLPEDASAASVCDGPYHHAELLTALSTEEDHGCYAFATPYNGWIGVNGQITTPTEDPQLYSTYTDHVNGFVQMVSTGSNWSVWNAWLQIGWYSGTILGCPTTPTNEYRLYVEWKLPGQSTSCRQVSPLSKGGSVIYRVEFEGSGCWRAYYNYNSLAERVCGLPNSMAASTSNELYNGTGRSTKMPRSTFGASDPNTNAALRIKGASGYQPWDSSLTKGGTILKDERGSFCPCYVNSPYAAYYHTVRYGG